MSTLHVNLVGNFASPSAAEWGALNALQQIEHVSVQAFNSRSGEVRRRRVPPLSKLTPRNTADLHIFMKGDGAPPELIAALRGLTVCWYAELLPNGRVNDDVAQAKFAQLSENLASFDVVAHHNADSLAWLSRQHPRVIEVPLFGVVRGVQRDGGPLRERRYDIGFCGAPSPRRVQFINQLHAANIPIKTPDNWESGGGIYGDAMFDFLASCRYFLNLHFTAQPNFETRVLEVLGSRTALLSERISGDSVRPDEHYFLVNQPADVVARLRQPLTEAQQVANAGYELAWRDFDLRVVCQRLITESQRAAAEHLAPQ